MRRQLACLALIALLVSVSVSAPGCGGSSGIEEGVPQNVTAPPPDFDPGGGATPDMSGKAKQATP